MSRITPEMIKDEKTRMSIELELFGRWLSVGTGESQAFWRAQRPIRWWQFWRKRKSQEES